MKKTDEERTNETEIYQWEVMNKKRRMKKNERKRKNNKKTNGRTKDEGKAWKRNNKREI